MFEIPLSYQIPIKILALLIAIIGHEILHGYVALKFGDTTAQDAGRLSLNPLVHIDLVGSILVPGVLFLSNAPFLFGWAKPVPVRIDRVVYHGGYFGAFSVSSAGIAFNFVLAIFVSLVIYFLQSGTPNTISILLFFFLVQLLFYNVILAVFNLIPIPPLDGSKMLAYLGLMLRNDFFAKLFDKIPPIAGMLVLIILLSTPLSSLIFVPIQFITSLLL